MMTSRSVALFALDLNKLPIIGSFERTGIPVSPSLFFLSINPPIIKGVLSATRTKLCTVLLSMLGGDLSSGFKEASDAS